MVQESILRIDETMILDTNLFVKKKEGGEIMCAKLIDLEGQQFGKLKVLRFDGYKVMPSGQRTAKWLCHCDCGNDVSVIGSNLRNGTSTSCGCTKRVTEDLVGQRFSRLTVVSREEDFVDRPGGAKTCAWRCKCDCGNEIVVRHFALKNGHVRSCGCLLFEEKVDSSTMLGKRFGRLTVVSRAPSHRVPSGPVLDAWNCVCDCGGSTVSLGRNLRSGGTQSCGCLRAEHISVKSRRPYSEVWVQEYLDEHGLSYVCQKTYFDLTGVNGGLLSYDFAVDFCGTVLIECQGSQHYAPVDFFGGEKQFLVQKEHDLRKRTYADKHGFSLLYIDSDGNNKDAVLGTLNEYFCKQ